MDDQPGGKRAIAWAILAVLLTANLGFLAWVYAPRTEEGCILLSTFPGHVRNLG